MEIDNKQEEFLSYVSLVNKGAKIKLFLTGRAGTGKTTCVNKFIELLNKDIKLVKLAPTGIAATLIGGQTIHSFFQIPPRNILGWNDTTLKVRTDKKKLWNETELIFFDEVSMLRPDILDFIDLQLERNKCNSLSTKSLIFVGDLKQLPAITDKVGSTFLLNIYRDLAFTSSKLFEGTTTITLDKIYRQKDEEFILNLNKVRMGEKPAYFKQFIKDTIPPDSVILCPHRTTASFHNRKELDKINYPLQKYKGKITGKFKDGDFIAIKDLEIKNTSRVMYLINDKEMDLVNGTLGKVLIQDNNLFFESDDGILIKLEPHTFVKENYVYEYGMLEKRTISSLTQYPILPAWALTIHKSQGQQFANVTIDISKQMFTENQLYVSLSRVISPEGLTLYKNK